MSTLSVWAVTQGRLSYLLLTCLRLLLPLWIWVVHSPFRSSCQLIVQSPYDLAYLLALDCSCHDVWYAIDSVCMCRIVYCLRTRHSQSQSRPTGYLRKYPLVAVFSGYPSCSLSAIPIPIPIYTHPYPYLYSHHVTQSTSINVKDSIYSYSIILINSKSIGKSTFTSDEYVGFQD
jgi:hypothetical protein